MARRGLCGDVYLVGEPTGPRIGDVKVVTSVRAWCMSVRVALDGLVGDSRCVLKGRVLDGKRTVREFAGKPFQKDDLKDGRIALVHPWKPEELGDIHTPENLYRLQLRLEEANGKLLDDALPVRFGFREFWIDGRDF